MLANSRVYQGGPWQTNFTATPQTANIGTGLTASASTNTKGSYATLIASTTYDSYGFWLGYAGSVASAAISDMLLDIALGASQQNIILPNFQIGWAAAAGTGFIQTVFIPIYIPKGSQISARIQAAIASDTVRVFIALNSGASGYQGPLFSGADAYGVDAATSGGTSHTAGNSGAESTDANVGSTTSRPYGAVMLSVNGTSSTTTAVAYHWELRIGSQTMAEWFTNNTTGELVLGPWPPCPAYVSIPEGTQLQVRGECSGTAQAQDIAYHCFY